MSYRHALLLALAACGSPSVTPDANTPDASTAPDAARAPNAQVSLIVGGVAIANAPVVVHDPSGAPRSTTHTGADGVAAIAVDDGDLVTAIDLATPPTAYTIAAVAPGDVLVLGDPARVPPPVVGARSVTVILPPRTTSDDFFLFSGTWKHELTAAETQIVVTVPDGATSIGLLLVQFHPDLASPIAWSAIAAAPTTGTVTLPDLVAFTTIPVAVHDIPADATHAMVGVSIDPFGYVQGGIYDAPAAGSIAGTAAFPTSVPGSFVYWRADHTDSGPGQAGEAPLPLDATSVDVTPRWLPWVSSATATAETRTVTFTTEGAGAYDATWTQLVAGNAQGSAVWQWDLMVPAGEPLVPPTLPAELANHFPSTPNLYVFDFALLAAADGGYPALRAMPGGSFPFAPGVLESRWGI